MTDALAIYYDAIIWLQGTFDAYSYADTTRLELREYLDKGGELFSNGDNVIFHLSAAGNNADSLIGFGTNYLGGVLTSSADETTTDRTLNMVGKADKFLAGCTLGVYGECPIRRTFDRIFMSVPGAGATADTVAIYGGSTAGAADNGRICAVECRRPVNNGGAVHFTFGLEALLSDHSRAVVLSRWLNYTGLPGITVVPHKGNGVDAPEIANGFGFNLANARPNPFKQATSIQFSVPTQTHVSIEVYNILGQKVRTLVNESMDANSYVRDWDGRSDEGAAVSSGIYFYKMVAGEFSATKKAVLLK
jgi:hypothetical protein